MNNAYDECLGNRHMSNTFKIKMIGSFEMYHFYSRSVFPTGLGSRRAHGRDSMLWGDNRQC